MSDEVLKIFFELDANSNTRERIKRPPFRWPGSKARSINNLLKYLPYRENWIDHTGGSGIVTLARQPSAFEVYNDRHSGLVAFFRCIRDSKLRSEFNFLVSHMMHSREEFIWCRDTWKDADHLPERAAKFYYAIHCSFASLGRNFGRSKSVSNPIAKALQNSIKGLYEISERFRLIQIENMDVVDSLRDFDTSDTVHYIDPDYTDTYDCYKHTVDHKRMLDTVMNCKGFVAVSGYDNPLYNSYKWTHKYSWEVHSAMSPHASDHNNNFAQDHTAGRGLVEEVLWVKE